MNENILSILVDNGRFGSNSLRGFSRIFSKTELAETTFISRFLYVDHHSDMKLTDSGNNLTLRSSIVLVLQYYIACLYPLSSQWFLSV